MDLEDVVGAEGIEGLARMSECSPQTANPYLSEFLSLRCAPDVLVSAFPVKRAAKEITESMAAIKHIRGVALKEPLKYFLYDLCAGNALTSVIAAHLLPIKGAVAIDKRQRKRNWANAKKFSYIIEDIGRLSPDFFPEDSIIVSVHACRSLAKKIVELYRRSDASRMVLMPCCIGEFDKRYQFIADITGKYYAWAFQLAEMADGRVHIDKNILSPSNALVVAEK